MRPKELDDWDRRPVVARVLRDFHEYVDQRERICREMDAVAASVECDHQWRVESVRPLLFRCERCGDPYLPE